MVGECHGGLKLFVGIESLKNHQTNPAVDVSPASWELTSGEPAVGFTIGFWVGRHHV